MGATVALQGTRVKGERVQDSVLRGQGGERDVAEAAAERRLGRGEHTPLDGMLPNAATEHVSSGLSPVGGSGVRPSLQARMHHYFEATCDRYPEAVALEWEGGRASYAELDRCANRLANYLLTHHVQPGARIGILVPRSYEMYVTLLGIQKAGAAFVPMDPSSPADRVEYFAEDAGLDLLITTSAFVDVVAEVASPTLLIDSVWDEVAAGAPGRPQLPMSGNPTAYIIYTSGSSGRPKGVDVGQASICNFLHVITEMYDVRRGDRVYQGMTISFDFAIEEVWPTWAVGATLVAGPTDGRRVGAGLTTFLEERAISLLYCVPTVLSTVERTIPSIRGLMVGGEACPSELVERWAPGRRMLNTYGPTEATVTCTVGVLEPGRPVTIGIPVPTYTALILDEQRRPVPDGADGELCIGGVGVANGYLNRPDLTFDRFIPHPVDPAQGRVYRTGDLARIQEDGEIVYLGRADAEVKIRGHRVDLGEIESVMMREPDVHTAAVKHLKSPETGDELAGYLVPTAGTDRNSTARLARLHEQLREVLPQYMVPSYLQWVDEMPMLPSGKVDRKSLPDPSTPRLIGGSGEIVEPDTAMEGWVRQVWAAAFKLDPEQISVEADFFADLSGHSLVAATVTSRLREDPRGAPMSVLDLYANPTIRALAQHLDLAGMAADGDPTRVDSSPRRAPAIRAPRWRIAAFGMAQLLAIFVIIAITTAPIALIYAWHEGVPSFAMLQQIILAFPAAYLAERWLLPLVVARVLGMRLHEGEYPLYGLTHFRVWLVGKSMALSPMVNLAGSAYAAPYLRLAGARIGEGCHIGTELIPLPGMVELEDNATVGYATHLQGYEIEAGRLVIGRVRLGPTATVAANCVLVGPCDVGAHAVLREQSSLLPGEAIPAGQTWCGAPVRRLPSAEEPITKIMADCDDAPREWTPVLKNRFAWGLVALEFAPLTAMLPVVTVVWWVMLTFDSGAAFIATLFTGPLFVASSCLIILSLRRFGLPKTPIGIHHLRSPLGVAKWFADKLLSLSLLLTNTLYSTLYTAPWLRRLGATIGPRAEVSTIANIDPDLLTIGEESFVADMASVGSAMYCNGHVAFRPTTIGRRAFVGNAAFVPSGNHLGDGSLLGACSVPPVSGVPSGTSWLGSPSIYLPRREVYDNFSEAQTFAPSRRQIWGRYVIEALRIVLPASILATALFATLLIASMLAEGGASAWLMLWAVPAVALGTSFAVVLIVAALKWVIVGRYRDRVEPLWNGFVRRTEFVTGVYEASAVPALLMFLQGTPFLGPVLRLYGASVGRRTLIDTTYLTEFDLVHIGDDASIGAAVSLQTHLFEDRVMKMNHVRIGADVSVGTRAVVLYSSDVGSGVHLAPLSLVMKGESLPAGTDWVGIPAQLSRSASGVRP